MGLIDQDRAHPYIGAVVLFFFLGVAAYARGFNRAMTAEGTAVLIVGFVVAVAAGLLCGDVGGLLGFGLGSLVVLAAGASLIRAY